MKTITMSFLAITLSILSCLGTAVHAWAGEAEDTSETVWLEPVIVNAEKRSEEAQEVPIGMSVLEQDDLLNMEIDSAADLAAHIPNLEFHDFGSRRHGLVFLRGIKSLPAGQAGIGFYVDGVNYNKAYMFGFPMFDLERVEVLRGSQGTLYGRNTTGGVINMYTAKPGNEFTSGVRTTFGNLGSREVQASSSGPLIEDKLFLGVYGQMERREGFMENDVAADGPDGRQQEGMAGRVKLRYLGSEDWETTLSLDAQHHDDGAYPLRRTSRNAYVKAGNFDADEYYHYSHDFEGEQEVDFYGGSLDSELQTSAGTLRSVTGVRVYDSNEWIDVDFSALDVRRQNYRQKDVDISQEFRLASPAGDGPLQWLVGTYLYHLDGDGMVNVYFGDDAGASAGRENRTKTTLRNTGAALFGEGTYTFFSKFDVTLGLRAEYEHAEGISTQTNIPAGAAATVTAAYEEQANYTALLPKLTLGWHFTDDIMAYASTGKAHKVGGFNTASAPDGSFGYDDESSLQYELGVKTLSLDKRLMVNVAAFYTEIEDEQLPLYQANLTRGYLDNAGESHRLGLELESEFKLTESWTLNGSYSWIEAEFDEYEDSVNDIDYAGKKVFCVPDYSFALGLGYRAEIEEGVDLFGRFDMSGVGPQFFDNANEVGQANYELFSTRIGLQWEGLEASLWAKNIFDRHYVAFENTGSGIAEDGEPRTFGISLSYVF